MNTVTITFTQEDLNNLTSLIDIAVRAQGLNAARAGLMLMAKLEQAVTAANTEPNPAVEDGQGAA